MQLLHADGRLTEATSLLLAAVSGVPEPLVRGVRVFPKARNWLRFPWYPAAKGGGAFVLGDRIYAHQRFFLPEHDHAFLFLLAHEVGHLPHAEPFGRTRFGRARFVCWAAGHYLRSALRNGKQAHRLARIEQEAERGRWVLREIMKISVKDSPLAQLEDAAGMREWLQRNASHLSALHRGYAGWPL
ncbi:MAG: hypothetical protein JNM62_07760 [Flavobacteriales bacterium]|nr:hypothetical protein [Flavobacteriales bacterium]